MLTEQDLSQHNIKSLDPSQTHKESQNATLQALKQLLPEVINADGPMAN